MKRAAALCALALITALAPAALAADAAWDPHANPAQRFAWGEEEQGSGVKPCLQAGLNGADFATTSYPTSVTRSGDGTEIRKIYDLSPEDDPAGIPRSGFEQEGFRNTLTDLLRQEAPELESRAHTETVSLESPRKDMESVLALLPQERAFTTEDGLTGTLSLKLDTVRVEPAGYCSAEREVSAARTYPNLAGQDASYIPKTIQENGRTLTLQSVQWLADNSASVDGYALGDRFTASALYTGTASSSYVTGYTVTADYTGTVSRIALNKVRYVAVFEGVPLAPEPVITTEPDRTFRWAYVLIPVGAIAAAGGGIGLALLLKRRNECEEESE